MLSFPSVARDRCTIFNLGGTTRVYVRTVCPYDKRHEPTVSKKGKPFERPFEDNFERSRGELRSRRGARTRLKSKTKVFRSDMQSCSPITRGLTSPRMALKRRFTLTRSSGMRRLGALRRVDTPEDLLGAAKSGLDIFVKRVSIDIDRERPSRARRLTRTLATKSHFWKTQKFRSVANVSRTARQGARILTIVRLTQASKAIPIILGADEDSADEFEAAEKLVEVTREHKAAALNRARVESLLKADAGRDDIFHAASQGLTGISGDVIPTGWWDPSGVAEASPELELQALNDDSRAQLVGAVLMALREALENIEENDGSLRDLIQNVARISANDWMNSMSLHVGSQVRCARVVQVSGEVADESIWKNGE